MKFLFEKIEYLKDLLPEVFSEGKLDINKIKLFFFDDLYDEDESFSLNWPGKSKTINLFYKTPEGSLKPDLTDSIDFEKSPNACIEGENLQIMKLLHKAYFNKVKLIYIDPPYNTGNDFIYNDKFGEDIQTYLKKSDQKDHHGNMLTSNPETDGRFHSNWLSMIYPRLYFARNLLNNEGLIFISIDDHEQANLKLIMNEIYGEENFVANICWRRRKSQANLSENISPVHDFILCYRKSNKAVLNKLPLNDNKRKEFFNKDNDPKGSYITQPCTKPGGQRYRVETPNGIIYEEEWSFSEETFNDKLKNNEIIFPRDGDGKPRYKIYLFEKEKVGILPNTWWDNVSSNQEGKKEFLSTTNSTSKIKFNPKPIKLLKRIIQLGTNPIDNHIVLDFFSGSNTTAEAVFGQNILDGGNRRFVCIQLAEKVINDNKSTVFELGLNRLRNYLQSTSKKLSLDKFLLKNSIPFGFRVFKFTNSNFIRFNDNKISSDHKSRNFIQRSIFHDILRNNWDIDHLIWEITLQEGLDLSSIITNKKLKNNTIYIVEDYLGEEKIFICLDKITSEDVFDFVETESRFICLDSALTDDLKTNLAQLYNLRTL